MDDKEKIQHLEGKNIRLQAEINSLVAVLLRAYSAMKLMSKQNDTLMDLIRRADKIIERNLELLETTPKQLRINFLLGILLGILILQTINDLIK